MSSGTAVLGCVGIRMVGGSEHSSSLGLCCLPGCCMLTYPRGWIHLCYSIPRIP